VCLHASADTDAYSTAAAPRKPILSARIPEHERLMRGMPADLVDADIARCAARAAWSWRNAWSVARGPHRDDNARLTKAEADAKLRKLMAQMIGGNR
jgi:hypothetical protein